MQSESQVGKSEIEKVIGNGYCIGCGSCATYDPSFTIKENQIGLYTASAHGLAKIDTSSVCPFSSKASEDVLAKGLFDHGGAYDKRIGYYIDVFSGHVQDQESRKNSSSGGIVTWVLQSLLRGGLIDGIIHVGSTERCGELFSYRISSTVEELQESTGSRYYPVHFDEVLKLVQRKPGKYAFVGVPCFVKAVRLLAEKDPRIKGSIIYCIAIFCGHFKTKSFAEMIGWQLGVPPNSLGGINFRVKMADRPANQYAVSVKTGNSGDIKRCVGPVQTRELYGMDWGLGYFKPKACDWCDDIAGETADLACGDAWLPEFESDSLGTSIMVVRNAELKNILERGQASGEITLEQQSVDKVYQSQAGNYRHRREGLTVRIESADKLGLWHPVKRFYSGDFSVPPGRRHIYIQRERLAAMSHEIFYKAKKKGSFLYFAFTMLPYELRYYLLNRRLLKSAAKHVYLLSQYVFRKIK